MKFSAIVPVVLLATPAFAQTAYPPTRTVDVSDTYFGKTYKDPYRWLEDLKDNAVEAWFKAQAELTDGLLGKISARDRLADEWMKLDTLQPARYSAIIWENGRVFYKKTLGGENVGKLYFREGGKGAEKLLFDPSSFRPKVAKQGDVTTIRRSRPRRMASHVASGFPPPAPSTRRSASSTWTPGKLLPESLYPSYGPGGWTLDRKALFYDAGKVTDIKSPDIELNRKTRLHVLGSGRQRRRLLLQRELPRPRHRAQGISPGGDRRVVSPTGSSAR